jgi:hypothetical protein
MAGIAKARWPKTVVIAGFVKSPVARWNKEVRGLGSTSRTCVYFFWHKAYVAAFRAFLPRRAAHVDLCSIEVMNTAIPAHHRALVYNTSWALLGYTKGQSEAVMKLAAKAKKDFSKRSV